MSMCVCVAHAGWLASGTHQVPA